MKKNSFEENIKKIEAIVTELENGSELETSTEKFEEAMKLIKECNKTLKETEKNINKILKETGELEDFKID